jgi:hypothetical protein
MKSIDAVDNPKAFLRLRKVIVVVKTEFVMLVGLEKETLSAKKFTQVVAHFDPLS